MNKNGAIVLNNIGGGINIWVDHLPSVGESVMGYGFEVGEDLAKGGNVAVAIQRLGIPTAIIGKLGCDEAGDRDANWLRESGVNCECLIQSPEAKTRVRGWGSTSAKPGATSLSPARAAANG